MCVGDETGSPRQACLFTARYTDFVGGFFFGGHWLVTRAVIVLRNSGCLDGTLRLSVRPQERDITRRSR